MSLEPFDLEWMGGVAERSFRRVRPGVEEMPWGTLSTSGFPPLLVDRGRVAWTEAAFNEYCTAAAFTKVLEALLAARAPVDLIGMCSDFLADELHHVELTSRVAMELGGGAPYRVDFGRLTMPETPGLDAFQLANERVVRTCCVGEAFSVPMLATAFRSAAHPLTRAVLERIVKDEAPHGRFGRLYLEWADDAMDDAERARLAEVALDMLRWFAPFWTKLTSRVVDGITSEGFRVEHVRALGFATSEEYVVRARRAVREEIVLPLAEHGIELAGERLEAMLRQGALSF